MPDYLRDSAFRDISEDGPEVGFNKIFFYDAFDRGEFIGHENEWVTVYEQKVLEYGQRYDDDKLTSVLDAMPSAVQIPVDQTRLPRGPPIKMVYSAPHTILPYYVKERLEERDGVRLKHMPQLQMEQMGTGKIGVWDNRPGDKVQYALVGNDVSDQMAYIHEPGKP
ncbi:14706_t:CDS:2 [Funneliformis caledonium]|uniref:14706_t:CDS:1 n=1 Tax=Funneliformis caledonium TaxID=1117310 RepID=A0A9N9G1X9_9GLOM|nr:14706_t:CDS:2 [Funneliformis caledonium]